jgi:uncharacterized protein DUF664
MSVTRPDPPLNAGERATLVGFLDYQRATLATKCEGLDAHELRRRPVPAANLSLLGLVRHLAEVEQAWFEERFLGVPVISYWSTDADPEAAFDGVDGADPDEAFALWREACETSRKILDGASLEDTFVYGTRGQISLRWVIVHLIEEYARHNGHADLIRESIDGATGE